MPNSAYIHLTGHLGRDAETKYTPTGKAVTSWSMAVSTGFGDHKSTTWYECRMWGDRGQKVAGFLIKGRPIEVRGEPSMRTFEGRDGTPRTVIEVDVDNVVLLGDGQRQDQPQPQPEPATAPASQPRQPSQPGLDEVPF